MPSVRMRKYRHQIIGAGLAEPRRFGRFEARRDNAVNAPALAALLHIRDVERTVGAVDYLHGAKAGIRRHHELGIRFVRHPKGTQAISRHRPAMTSPPTANPPMIR